jgi:lycopene beta-cyclase
LNFYKYARKEAQGASNLTWRQEKVESVNEKNEVAVDSTIYHGDLVYDSRITDDYKKDKNSITLAQHFLGWIIRTEEDFFNPDSSQ